MPFQISRVTGRVEFETLPVAIITRYPLEPRDYKPYAQCCLCLTETALHLRMWAFEVYAPEGSELRLVLYPFADPSLVLHVRALAGEPVRAEAWVEDVSGKLPVGVTSRPYHGEDLQGVYWGAEICLPYTALAGRGLRVLSPGENVPGNFYKLCFGEGAHMGSYYPASFPDDPFGSDSMDSFMIVAY